MISLIIIKKGEKKIKPNLWVDDKFLESSREMLVSYGSFLNLVLTRLNSFVIRSGKFSVGMLFTAAVTFIGRHKVLRARKKERKRAVRKLHCCMWFN